MIRESAGSGIVLVLALAAASAQADPPPPDAAGGAIDDDPAAAVEAYAQEQRDLFDSLRSDPSPRVQVLAGRIHFDEGDLPDALRPNREEIIARAARLAPEDAFVQWAAADQGRFANSQCGPTRWPEAEVANLVRLEPGNAGALQFAVALAQARGDPAALDDALAGMAAAVRADDYLGDEIAAWRKVYEARPMEGWQKSAGMTPQTAALQRALMQTRYYYSSAASALSEACRPDAQSERAWQRLGWCADAGRLLAAKGNSFALRERGLELLETSGAQGEELAELRRQLDWLQAHAADPMTAFDDAPSDLVADWQGAPDEIAAAERRLDRLGQPRTAPAGWTRTTDGSQAEDAADKASLEAWQAYMRALIEDMRGSGDARAQALALTSGQYAMRMLDSPSNGERPAAAPAAEADPLAGLAAANPDDLLVQWIVATSFDMSSAETRTRAIAHVQRLDAGNAAAWVRSLPPAGTDVPSVLRQMAAASRYDEHLGDLLGIWLAAIQKRAIPTEALGAFPMGTASSAEAAAKGVALGMAMMNSISATPSGSIARACGRSELGDAQRREACTAIGRLMLNSSRSLVAAKVGESLLRNADALSAAERERARQLAWWSMHAGALDRNDEAIDAYFADYLSTGSEIEAMRLAATRAGKAEPPANWTSPAEKRAEKRN